MAADEEEIQEEVEEEIEPEHPHRIRLAIPPPPPEPEPVFPEYHSGPLEDPRVVMGVYRPTPVETSKGRWMFVGSVPVDLYYVHEDGHRVSHREAEELADSPVIAQTMKRLRIVRRTWATRSAAVAAQERLENNTENLLGPRKE